MYIYPGHRKESLGTLLYIINYNPIKQPSKFGIIYFSCMPVALEVSIRFINYIVCVRCCT